MNYNIKLLPFILGAVSNMFLGAMWYSPLMFAKVWMKEANITEEYMEVSKGKMGKVYFFTTIMAFVTSYVIGFVIKNMNIDTLINGLLLAILLWLGTNLPSIIKNWGFENRSIKLGMINHCYDLSIYIIIVVLYILL